MTTLAAAGAQGRRQRVRLDARESTPDGRLNMYFEWTDEFWPGPQSLGIEAHGAADMKASKRRRSMKYLCLICIDEKVDAMSKSEFDALVGGAPDDEEETARDAREEMGT
jgi:hypothetical protein